LRDSTEKCVEALNQFQRDHRPKHLVACCRLAEYQNSIAKLQLHSAVQLHPLTDEQIQSYLGSAESLELWKTIRADAELLELARCPLLLSTLTLAYKEGPIQGPKEFNSAQERLQFVFNIYIERMFSRASKGQEYSKEKTLHWLTWLANRLREQAQTEFLIERLQPIWLQSAAQKLTYRVGVVLIVAFVFGVADFLKDWLMGFVPRGKLGIGAANWVGNWETAEQGTQIKLAIGMILGLTAGLIVGLKQTIRPIETLKWSGARGRREMVLGLQRWSMTGLKYGAYIGLIAGYIVWPIFYLSLPSNLGLGNELAKWGMAGQIAGVISGLLAGVAAVLIARSGVRRTGELWDWRTIRSADGVISGLIWGIASGVSLGGEYFQLAYGRP
jgi:hypothetical protein